METAQQEQTQAPAASTQPADQQLESRKDVLDAVARRGIDEFQWRTLMGSLFPGARAASVLMVIDYCRARKLDPMKKPCHIVPMRVKNAQTGNYETRDVVMPGIYEYRTTAMRTGLYEGHTKPEYGPEMEVGGVKAPAWCEMTMFRTHPDGVRQIPFPVHVDFIECVALSSGKPNDRWSKAPRQMLTKCTEAAGLREAFPDEFGGESTAEEMDGRETPIEAQVVQQPIKAAERISEQVKTAPAQESSQAPEPVKSEEKKPEPAATEQPAAAGAVLNVGTIEKIETHGEAIVVVLNTGFKCSTRDADLKSAAKNLQASERVVELVTSQNGDPKKFMPHLTEILPMAAAQ